VGNYLNGQSNRGGAYGFKLDNIEKLLDVKTQDNKRNLLMYVLTQVGDLHISIAETEIEQYDILSKLPISQLTIDLNEIKRGTIKIHYL
jgi:diaphanous 1